MAFSRIATQFAKAAIPGTIIGYWLGNHVTEHTVCPKSREDFVKHVIVPELKCPSQSGLSTLTRDQQSLVRQICLRHKGTSVSDPAVQMSAVLADKFELGDTPPIQSTKDIAKALVTNEQFPALLNHYNHRFTKQCPARPIFKPYTANLHSAFYNNHYVEEFQSDMIQLTTLFLDERIAAEFSDSAKVEAL